MRNFNQLLRDYIERVGISDAELARAVGVRRQTIFRWKEGTVARPRHREDVLAVAKKLRLTPAERDELLVAAGFHPEGPALVHAPEVHGTQRSVGVSESRTWERAPSPTGPRPAQETGPRRRSPGGWWAWLIGALVALVLATIGAVAYLRRPPDYPLAGPGETLVVVGQFANFTGGEIGFNVAGRIVEPLVEEIEAAGLPNVRVATWPQTIESPAEAEAALTRSGATILIWGEYDSGRVLTRLLRAGQEHPDVSQIEAQVASPEELSATINSQVPQDVRYVALLTLGQLYSDAGRYEQARTVLERAAVSLPQEDDARATLYFRLGLAYQLGEAPDLERAIDAYTQTLAVAPEHVAARYNRGLAYLYRGRSGDLESAIADFTGAIRRNRSYAPALIGRGVAYFYRGGEGDDVAAIADFSRAIELDDARTLAFYNRGLLYIRLDERENWETDLLRTVELAPAFGDGHAALCWGYVLDAEAEKALPHCDRAIDLGSQIALDSRGIAYLERDDIPRARQDFEAFLAWLDEQPEDSPYRRYRSRVETWLAALAGGENPLTPETLERLRLE